MMTDLLCDCLSFVAAVVVVVRAFVVVVVGRCLRIFLNFVDTVAVTLCDYYLLSYVVVKQVSYCYCLFYFDYSLLAAYYFEMFDVDDEDLCCREMFYFLIVDY
jgi:hypothetical protein